MTRQRVWSLGVDNVSPTVGNDSVSGSGPSGGGSGGGTPGIKRRTRNESSNGRSTCVCSSSARGALKRSLSVVLVMRTMARASSNMRQIVGVGAPRASIQTSPPSSSGNGSTSGQSLAVRPASSIV